MHRELFKNCIAPSRAKLSSILRFGGGLCLCCTGGMEVHSRASPHHQATYLPPLTGHFGRTRHALSRPGTVCCALAPWICVVAWWGSRAVTPGHSTRSVAPSRRFVKRSHDHDDAASTWYANQSNRSIQNCVRPAVWACIFVAVCGVWVWWCGLSGTRK